MKPIQFIPVALSLLLANQASAQSKIFVKAGASGAHTGTSWATAFDDLTPALNAASAGDSIFVAAGTYKPTSIAGAGTDRDKTFLLKDRVSLFGGFAGTETKLADRNEAAIFVNASILSGNIGTPDSLDNCYHVITAVNISNRTMLNGFIVSEGNANGSSSNLIGTVAVPRNSGGGIYNANSNYTADRLRIVNNVGVAGGAGVENSHSPISISNSLISNNVLNGSDTTTGGGAGMRNSNSNCQLSKVNFSLNKAYGIQGGGAMRNENSVIVHNGGSFSRNYVANGDGGAGIYNAAGSDGRFTDISFSRNSTARQGGAMYNDNSSPTLNNVDFYNNTADNGGGAMENDGGSNAILNEVYFLENSTLANGGAMQNWKSSPVINNAYFEENIAAGDGGALYNYNNCNTKITNSYLQYNKAGLNGGGLFNKRNSNPVITNTLIIGNTAGKNGGGVYNIANTTSGAEPASPVFTNVVIANNTAGNTGGGGFDDGFGSSLLRNSIVMNNSAPVIADIDAPLASVATALFHTIVGDQYFETGTTTPTTITSDVFADIRIDDFRLAKSSPAIDKGDSSFFKAGAIPDLTIITTDLRNGDRIMGANIDLGVFEVCTDTIKPSVTITPPLGVTVPAGTAVNFTATAINAGSNPFYSWYKNGIPVGVYTDTYAPVAGIDFSSGDLISVAVLGSAEEPCMSDDTAKSAATFVIICNDPSKTSVTITPSATTTVSSGTTVNFTATVTNGGISPRYSWRKNDVPVGVYTPTYAAVAGTDFVSGDLISVGILTSLATPCSKEDTVKSPATQMLISMGISDPANSTAGFNIYPNPNNGDFTIETANAKDYTLRVLDLTGRTVHSMLLSGSSNTLNLSGKIPSGTYLLSIEQQGSPKQVKRFILQ